MRDIIVVGIVVAGAIAALRRPWIGVILWTWLSIMNPHRYTYGFAYGAPLAATAAGATLVGLFMTKDRESPFKSGATVFFALFIVWFTLSWLFGIDPSDDYEQWKKVIKVDLMILVTLALLRTKQHILALTWVAAGSLALLGIKGGIFTLAGGGSERVWGPPGSFIEDNNEFAVALIMTIPLLRFLQLQIASRWGRHLMSGAMILCAVAALGSQSRGALLAIAAMVFWIWWNGKNKFAVGILIVLIAIPLISFMPDSWDNRMSTIGTYETDGSAMGRISAWWNAWNLAFHYPFGVGFNAARPELFARYSPYPDSIHAAHSIYFQILGNHGFFGLALFLAVFGATWLSAGWLRRQKFPSPDAKWCNDLGAMCQVALAGYAVGGAFLSLAYFDLPYDILVLVTLTRAWAERKAWQAEPADGSWRAVLGIRPSSRSN
jgi:putative inorganic carbon (HCO3(-)) transporter